MNIILLVIGLLALASIGITLYCIWVFLYSFRQTIEVIRSRNCHLSEQVDASLEQGSRLMR